MENVIALKDYATTKTFKWLSKYKVLKIQWMHKPLASASYATGTPYLLLCYIIFSNIFMYSKIYELQDGVRGASNHCIIH